MSWIADRLVQQRQSAPPAAKRETTVTQIPTWQTVWNRVCDALRDFVDEFNQGLGSEQFVVQPSAVFIQVVPGLRYKREHIGSAVLTIEDKDTGTFTLTCPPQGAELNRHGKFRIRQDQIEAAGDFVGRPQPEKNMSAEAFARFVLDPLLFPDLQ